jgi:hypothetical protein
MSTTVTTSATFDVGPHDTLTMSTGGRGTIVFTSLSGKLVNNQPLSVQNGTFGPFGVPGSITLTMTAGSCDYTVNSYSLTQAQVAATQALVSGSGIAAGLPVHGNLLATRRVGYPLMAYPRAAANHGTIARNAGALPTTTYTTRDGIPVVRMEQGAGSAWMSIPTPTFSRVIPNGRLHVLMYVPDPATFLSAVVYLGDNALTNYYTCGLTFSTGAQNGAGGYGGWYVFTCDPNVEGAWAGLSADTLQRRWGVSGGTPTHAGTTMTTCSIRFTSQVGQLTSVELAGVWADEASALPNIVFTADDGVDTQYTAMLPIMEKYGLRLSQMIIAPLIGAGGFCTLPQLQDAYARGHECGVHGNPAGGGNLAVYSTAAEVAADINVNRSYVINNGLARNGSENLYAYPQGIYQSARGNTTVQDGMTLAGITHARLASGNGAGILINQWTKKQRRHHIDSGYGYNSGDEAGNLSRKILQMQQAAALGRSTIWCFHNCIASPSATTDVSLVNFEALCAAVAELVTSGSARNLLFSEFCAEVDMA